MTVPACVCAFVRVNAVCGGCQSSLFNNSVALLALWSDYQNTVGEVADVQSLEPDLDAIQSQVIALRQSLSNESTFDFSTWDYLSGQFPGIQDSVQDISTQVSFHVIIYVIIIIITVVMEFIVAYYVEQANTTFASSFSPSCVLISFTRQGHMLEGCRFIARQRASACRAQYCYGKSVRLSVWYCN